MSNNLKKTGLWILIAVLQFAFFRWLFGLAMPEAAWQFALGMTLILTGGLFFGRFVARLWFKADDSPRNSVFAYLTAVIVTGLISIGVLVSKMIQHTDFMHFFYTVIILFLVTAAFGAIISLIRHRIRTRILTAQNALAHSRSELQLLQSQLSPHFLFNTLNNLYGLSITDHSKVPPLLLRLSELLRYSVYDAKETFVPLKDELDYLRNYIEFEKIRLGERLELKLNVEDAAAESFKIAPMLLIVFVENAFKHSKDSPEEKIFIEISLQLQLPAQGRLARGEQGRILFSVKNSCLKSGPRGESAKKHSGFGLESVRKRLNFLYRNMHEMKIEESEREYAVSLILYNK